MRRFLGVVLLLITAALVYILDHPLGALPAIGHLIDPVNGCWANAEPVNMDFSGDHTFPGMEHPAIVWIDSQMVPHIHAGSDHDVFFIEGYIHASCRLWQMDMETRAAAGRVSEVVGEKALTFDRNQRRKGMGYAAENSLRAMEADPRTKLMIDAYTAGINNYIASLSYRTYPLEYKLIGFAPEPWTNLKSALLLKYMADDLTGSSDDIALTFLRDALPKEEFDLFFPEKIAGSSPVIPKGTTFDKLSLTIPVAPPDSVAFPHFSAADFGRKRELGKGSNNWAVSGARTASGAPILCDDPHLMLNLPSLWYAIQLQAPGMNVYGASLPGAPGVVIGFNDSLTWGVTNNYRDVKDFYLVKPVAGNNDKYWFAGKQLDYTKRIEHIAVKNKPDVVDTINYTLHGPVVDEEQNASVGGLRRPLAMCWMGHRATNEMLAIYLMNTAKNYQQFVAAIMNFQCPAQNFAYADRVGNIAMWGQGQFVNKWKEQGRFVMDGSDSATLWGQLIPMGENPHVLNPGQGYVASANQSVTDDTYPYWYDGDFIELRAWRINQLLGGMNKVTIEDMFAMQQDTYSYLAANVQPLILKYPQAALNKNTSSYHAKGWDSCLALLNKWDYKLSAETEAGTVFQVWWYFLYNDLLQYRFGNLAHKSLVLQERVMQLIQSNEFTTLDSATKSRMATADVSAYDAFPPKGGPIEYAAVNSFMQMVDSVRKLKQTIGLDWYKVKNTSVTHLAKLPAFSYDHLKIGGWGNTINAAKGDHGPSWRMVVQMGKEIEAYGVYPGGQSGNPGSKHYADYLQNWVDGKYNRLQFLPNTDQQSNASIKYTWTVH